MTDHANRLPSSGLASNRLAGNRLVAVDGLRGIAAICVALMHAKISWTPVMRGYLAVDFFFVLSGYVIARGYEPRFAGGMTVREYAWLRLERLYPLLAIGSAIGVGLWMLGYSDFVPVSEADRVRALIGQFTMVPYLSSATGLAFDAALWSISFELLANVVHALVFRRLDMLRLVALVVASFVVLVFMGHRFGSLDIGWSQVSALGGIGRVLFGFFVGVLICRTEPMWRPHMPCLPFAAVGLMLMIVVNAPIRSHDWGNLSTLYDIVAVALVMPALVMLGVAARGAGKGALFLGVLSFPIYAIHVPLVNAMRLAGWSTATRLAGVFAIALAAWALGRYIDEPLNAWRRASRKRKPAGRPMTAPPRNAAA